eukprot:gene15797-21394_t
MEKEIKEWALDPIFSSFRSLFIIEIKSKINISEKNGVFQLYYNNEPILKAEVCGIIVNVVLTAKRIQYVVDDGTSTIRCFKPIFITDTDESSNDISGDSAINNKEYFKVGDMVSIKGVLALSETNYDNYGFCIQISIVSKLDDPNYEAYHWLNTIYQR